MYRWPRGTWKNTHHHYLLEKCKSKLQGTITSYWSEWPSTKNLQIINAGEVWRKGKTIQWRKNSLFNKCCWKNWTALCKRIKLEHCLIPHTKINSKWIKDLNYLNPETIKLLEENIGKTLFDINCSKIFFDPPPKVMKIKTKISKRDLIKLQTFCTAKETINKLRRQPS